MKYILSKLLHVLPGFMSDARPHVHDDWCAVDLEDVIFCSRWLYFKEFLICVVLL